MILKLQNVEGYYNLSQVLFGVSLEVEEGDSVCLLGRNGGVGKSTTLKCVVGGQLSPEANATTKGNIVFDGTELVGMPAFKIARLGIGYVPQGRRIFPTLSVKENLMIAERSGVNGEKVGSGASLQSLPPPQGTGEFQGFFSFRRRTADVGYR